jgi:hypothetical protein
VRVFSIIGLLISLLIVGWLSASYLATVTGTPAVIGAPASVLPADGTQPLGASPTASPIDRARELASMDLERQKQMEDLIRK